MSGRKPTPDVMGDLLNGKAPAKPEPKSFDLVVPDDFTRDGWEEFGARIATADARIRFVIGDWIIAGSNKWGDMYADAQRITGKSKQYLTDCVWVARAFELSSREDNLSWSHHRALASAKDEDRKRLQAQAEDEGLSVRKTKALVDEIDEGDAAGQRTYSGTCKLCGRKLTDGTSVTNGMGPCCAAKAARGAGSDNDNKEKRVRVTITISEYDVDWIITEAGERGWEMDWTL